MLIACDDCQASISYEAVTCPKCGKPQPMRRPLVKSGMAILFGVVVVVALLMAGIIKSCS